MELTYLSGLDANPRQTRNAKAKAKKPVVQPIAAPVFKPSIWEQLATTAQQIIPVVVAGVAASKNQKRIDKIQEQRLATGKELLSAEEIDRYMDATAPVVKVKGGVDNNTSKYLAIGGIGIVGLLVLMNRNKGQRRG